MATAAADAGGVRYGTAAGRWVIVATVLGSGVAFLGSTVVNVALPSIGRDLHTALAGLQWTVDAYLLTLGSLIIVGGSLGDLYGRRRMFLTGLIAFAAASVLCGLAPDIGLLVAARAVQGVGGALLVPGSLAILSASFHPDDRSRAVGAWSGLAGTWTAIGPFIGGWLVDGVSWRLVFLINIPVIAITVWLTVKHVPESSDTTAAHHVDVTGAAAVSLGLAGAVYALIEGPGHGFSGVVAMAAVVGAAGLLAFPLIERRRTNPMVPLEIFRNSQFSGANLTTFAVYGGLGASTFLLVVHLQRDLGYSALEAGAAFVPMTILLFALSARAGAFAHKIGPRWPMTVGPVIAGAGLLLLGRASPGRSYFAGVLPGVLVLGLGLTCTVAPLTSAVLASVEDRHLGLGSAVNNAVARVAGLLAVAVLPAVTGLTTATTTAAFTHGFRQAMEIAAVLAVIGGAVACVTIRSATPVTPTSHVDLQSACHDPCVQADAPPAAAA